MFAFILVAPTLLFWIPVKLCQFYIFFLKNIGFFCFFMIWTAYFILSGITTHTHTQRIFEYIRVCRYISTVELYWSRVWCLYCNWTKILDKMATKRWCLFSAPPWALQLSQVYASTQPVSCTTSVCRTIFSYFGIRWIILVVVKSFFKWDFKKSQVTIHSSKKSSVAIANGKSKMREEFLH